MSVIAFPAVIISIAHNDEILDKFLTLVLKPTFKTASMKAFILLLCIFSLAFVANAQSIKIKITGITAAAGEEVIAFETGDSIAASSSYGSGGATGIPTFEFVKIKKLKDVSTNELFKRSVNGTHTADVSFEFYDNNASLFYQVVLKDVTVNHFSYLSPECAGCTKLYHQVWFDYRQIEVTDIASGNVVRYNRATRTLY